MLQNTKGIVLRSVKYGESSLIVTIFTELFGVQSYLAQGVRKAKKNNAGLLQPTTLLEIETDHKPVKNLQRIRNFNTAFLYQTLQGDVIKNSIAIFSVEVLLKLLPEHAPFPELFELSYDYFLSLDRIGTSDCGNFPISFLINIGELLGYKVKGEYSTQTPYLDLQAGGFVGNESPEAQLNEDDTIQLNNLMLATGDNIATIRLSSNTRNRLTDWYLDFLRIHSQHLGQIRSLEVLRAILH
jgi:DNA repair protein RecO (recombination protein O)